MRKSKKLLSVLLTICMLLSVVPMMTFTASAASIGDTFTVSNLGYTVLSVDGNKGTVSVKAASTAITGAISIPSSVTVGGVTYTVTEIAYYGFGDCKSLTSVTIPNTVEIIQNLAFIRCTSLKSIEIPNSVKFINNSAFAQCTGLQSAIISDSVEEFGQYVFQRCTNLESVSIGKSLARLNGTVFNYCTKLTQITVSADNPYFSAKDGIIYSKDGTTLVSYHTATGSVTVPSIVTEIGDYAFHQNSNITSIKLPEKLITIGEDAFSRCTNLKSIEIPDGVRTIKYRAFYYCSGITSVTIPASVDIIGGSAFNKVKFANVTFKGDELPTIYYDSFVEGSISIDTVTNKKDSNVSVDIVGFKNGKSNSEEAFWAGELLKPVVTGYTGSDTLYYRFETNHYSEIYDYTSNYTEYNLTFYTSDTNLEDNGDKAFFIKDEAFAALTDQYSVDYIKCSVYTVEKDSSTGNFKATLLAESDEIKLSNLITDMESANEKEFTTKNVLVMQQGESATLTDILASAGFTHIKCHLCRFYDISTEKYNDNDLTVNKITDGSKYTTITASTEKTGLSLLKFNFYSTGCAYHSSSYSVSDPLEVTMYIYVVKKPDFTATTDTITVKDNSVLPATSTYRLGVLGDVNTTFTGLEETTEYDIFQTLTVPVGTESYTGVYHNYVSTKKSYTVSCNECTNGALEVSKTATYEGDEITVTAIPDTGYGLGKITAIYNDGNEKELTVTDGTFTMPAYDVTVSATFVSENVANAAYYASLTLNKNIDINFKMSNLGTDGNGTGFDENLLTITVDGNTWTDYTVEGGTLSGVLKSVEPKNIGTDLNIVITYNGVTVRDFNYSVKSYCNAVFTANTNGKYDSLADLCEAILNYGKYAEDYANGNTESTVNDGHEVTLTAPEKNNKAVELSTGVTAAGASLTLDSTISMNFYVKVKDSGIDLTEIDENGQYKNFQILNNKAKKEKVVTNLTVTPLTDNADGYNYKITISNIYAEQMSREYTLTLNGDDTFKVTYGVYDYCFEAQTEFKDDTTFTALCKAIYNYGVKAADFAG